jgi:hypothetical protein
MPKHKYSREQCTYDPPTNEKVVSLLEQHEKAREEVKRIAKEINKIREECEHTYFFTTSGAYDDFYECSKCGHETYI